MTFSLVDRDFDYGIGTVDYDTGIAIVYDSHDEELFRIKHEAWWNEASAISGTAKDIVHRLHKWRTEHPN